MRLNLSIAAALFLLAGLAGSAGAQVYGPRIPPRYGVGYRPALSPYLNLLRGGDISANYYLGVRPEFQRRRDADTLYSRTRELENRTGELEEADEDVTIGTPADFGDTRSYFATPNTYYQRVAPPSRIFSRPPARGSRNK